ncbi:GGDEF domain-containing protein [Alkalihalobacterium bogoriense]|uniref:GGDEF domain-containing protein n=1 Tax=Alkalihalobacterium bogoriense TaxID=246272 RepID=UPI00047A0887|nr:sensor domain-containing diguanylate cyclase [Alkalihalobacterium bogoriense]
MNFIILTLCVVIVAFVINACRFFLQDKLNRLLICLFMLGITLFVGFFTSVTYLPLLLLFFIIVATYSFPLFGTIVSPFIAYGFLYKLSEPAFITLLYYIVFSWFIFFCANQIIKSKKLELHWQTKFMKKEKQLQIFQEINTAMQQTFDLDKLLHTILTAVTAGRGFRYNRAMIFMFSEDNQSVTGKMAVGPMNVEKGYETWEMILENKYKLRDLVEMSRDEHNQDGDLNQIVRSLTIPLQANSSNIFWQALTLNKPLHIKEIDTKDSIQHTLKSLFSMEEFAVIPLANQGKRIGVLIIDNIVNKNPIFLEEVEAVIPLANQAAIAIDQANLYHKTEEMALKDGLTNLFNQRAFQHNIKELFSRKENTIVSLAILDIDFFKHYNDTNGHLIGNELLIQLATVLANSIPNDATPYRFGGEEFVILYPSASLEVAMDVAETVRKAVEAYPFPFAESQPLKKLTISIGVSSTEDNTAISESDLIQKADEALYEAKRAGKNKVAAWRDSV